MPLSWAFHPSHGIFRGFLFVGGNATFFGNSLIDFVFTRIFIDRIAGWMFNGS